MNDSEPPPRRSRRGRRRPSRRSDEHSATQAEAERAPAPAIIDHPLVPAAEPETVSTEAGLETLVQHVRSIASFAYDTEFIGEESYHPRFCLIQIATPDQIALVDPLADLDVTPIWELIADPDIETIVHAGQQDLEPVARFLDRVPANVFDTQIAAGFLHLPYPLSLRNLVREFMGVRLGKALTFTRWDQRPLSPAHTRYAADDVRYLPAIREVLRCRLEEAGHTRWVSEEGAGLSQIERYRFDPDSRVARLLNNRSMRRQARSVLRELVILRDNVARARDVPPRTFLRDDVLVRLARASVTKVAGLGSIKGLPRPVRERYGNEIIEATLQGIDRDAESPKQARMPEESFADRMRIDSLWWLVSIYCLSRSIDPSLVTRRRDIALFYFASLKGRSDGGARLRSNLTSGWRRELIGDLLQDLLDGKVKVELQWDDGMLRAEVRPTADG